MSRWICIDDICIPSDENDWEELVAFADAIAEQEPIDIVRCKECRWNENTCINHGEMKPWCKFTDYVHTADDFCSYGERREP